MYKTLSTDDERIIQAKAVNDFSKRMAHSCFDMCVTNFYVKKLDIQEETCTDRCAFKYFAVHTLVREDMMQKGNMLQMREQITDQQNSIMNTNA